MAELLQVDLFRFHDIYSLPRKAPTVATQLAEIVGGGAGRLGKGGNGEAGGAGHKAGCWSMPERLLAPREPPKASL